MKSLSLLTVMVMTLVVVTSSAICEPRQPGYSLDEYTWDMPPFEWVDISTVGTPTVNCDDCTNGPFQLGFSFPFYAQNFASAKICANGYLIFATFMGASIWECENPFNMRESDVCPFYGDLNPGSGGQVLYYADSANSRFIVSWINVPFSAENRQVTFQVILGADGEVLMQYLSLNGQTLVTSVGMQEARSPNSMWLGCEPNEHLLHDSLAIRFAPLSDNVPQPALISSCSLSAFPNPFNSTTTISFSLPSASKAEFAVFDILGKSVDGILSTGTGYLQAGEHRLTFDGSSLPTGIYFVQMKSASALTTQKLLLLK